MYVAELLTPVKSYILDWNLLYSCKIECDKGSNKCLYFLNVLFVLWYDVPVV